MPDNEALPTLTEQHVAMLEVVIAALTGTVDLTPLRDIELYVRAIQSGESVVVKRKDVEHASFLARSDGYVGNILTGWLSRSTPDA